MSFEHQRHSFTNSTSQRRASVVYGSVGKGGLYVPSDFLKQKKDVYDSEDENAIEQAGQHDSVNDRRRSSIISGELINEERQLLLDNNISIKHYGSENRHYSVDASDEDVLDTFDEAVDKGDLDTTTAREFKVLGRSSLTLIATFLLQNSLSTVSIFSVGHLGATELAAVSLGAMTANITGYATIQGLATALDTLCPQAYGAKRFTLVGVYMQRCTALIFTIMIPVLICWVFFSGEILRLVIPDATVAKLAGNYIKVVALGIPGYILFETGKRFLQSQGIFHASSIVLLICAPLNALLNYLLVWNKYIGIGYLGAPLAVAINYWLMAIGLLVYTLNTKHVSNPIKCWGGLQIRESFQHWGRLSQLALPGVVMIEAEFLAFEFLTLLASYLGTTALAAQSVATAMASLTYQVPFAIGIASSTRIANFLGAGLPFAAKKCSQVSLIFGMAVSLLNFLALFLFSDSIARAFTSDVDVIREIKKIFPTVAFMQIADAMNANSAGCLRGQGQQKIGGIVNLFSYYVIGIPLSILLTFKYDMGLIGLWVGSTVALIIIGIVQSYYSLVPDWNKLVQDAKNRNNEESSDSIAV